MTAWRDDDSDDDTDRETYRSSNHAYRSVADAVAQPSRASSHPDVVAADLLNDHRAEPSRHQEASRPHEPSRHHEPSQAGWRNWALTAIIMVAVAQAAYIGYLVSLRPPTVTIAVPEFHTVNPSARAADAGVTVWQAMSLPSATATPPAQPSPILDAPAAAVRSGGVRLISRIEMQLLDGERVLGSSVDGPIVTSAGRHEFELVNSALGYRSKQVFNIKAGEILSVPIRQPEGQVSINAVPWADIWIDGTHVGETPLANLSLPIGQHEVSFRHPSLAEQRRTTVIRYDVPTRLSADLR